MLCVVVVCCSVVVVCCSVVVVCCSVVVVCCSVVCIIVISKLYGVIETIIIFLFVLYCFV